MILHITNDYSGSTVYKNLVRELDNLGIQQIVYNPVREESRVGKNEVAFKTEGSKIIYRAILNYTTDRAFYPLKTWKIFRDIQKQLDLKQIDFIHAHTWYSDGGVAFELSKRYDIPYIVTIRNTDLNLFQKRLKYIRPFGRKILDKAQNIILISASYKNRVLAQSSLKSIKESVGNKIKVVPNGVDPFWIEQAGNGKTKTIDDVFRVLYVGQFTKGKNVYALQQAVKQIGLEKNINIQLQLVGGGGAQEEKVLEQVKQYPQLLVYHGKIYDKMELQNIFNSCHIFAMPSKHETFGLVYIEALLNGLPVLYTENEGIDGFYDGNIGEKVTDGDIKEIKQKLELLCRKYNNYKIDIPLIKKNHDWGLIAEKYMRLYQSKSLR